MYIIIYIKYSNKMRYMKWKIHTEFKKSAKGNVSTTPFEPCSNGRNDRLLCPVGMNLRCQTVYSNQFEKYKL